ncbi:MAG: xanthine dehydrogenase family protein subunit M [Candidatus Latescibacteria bacterium]|nr:xanthine dehydrogenase family protein subunit M [Candidatus Latescibacterota bacterium]
MHAFDFANPQSVPDAVGLLQKHGDRARVLAGGTDVIVQLREGRRSADLVVDIKEIPDVNVLSYSATTGAKIGAAVPCYRIYGNEEIAGAYPGIMDAASLVGGIAVQGRASLGGNLCNASPAADTIPTMIVHSAVCTVAGPSGTRQVAVEDFCTGPGRNVLESGEFLVAFDIPAPSANSGGFYLRFIPRNEMDIAVVGAGAYVVLNADKSKFESARIAVGAVAPTPLFVREAGEALAGQAVSDASIERACELARAAASPIDDMRGTADYRKHLTGVLTKRAIQGAVQRAKES